MESNRREFLKRVSAGLAGVALTGSAFASSAKSYLNIPGANDRLNVAIIGLGRRLEAYFEPVAMQKSNVKLLYLCDVM